MAYWFAGSVAWTAVTAWATGTAKAAGVLVRQLAAPTVGNERVFVCIVAGTTHATTEPTWVITKGAKTTDNTLTWQECTGQPGVNGSLTYCPLSSSVRSTTPALGAVIQNNAGTFLFICTTSGAAGAGEPAYNTTAGVTTTDSSCIWTSIGAVGNFGLRAAPHARLANAYAATWGATGDTFWVDDNHAETQASLMTLTSPGSSAGGLSYTYCVDHTVANPGTANLKTAATITVTGNFGITFAQGGYWYGIIFNCGTGANATNFALNPSGATIKLRFEACAFIKPATTGAYYALTFNNLSAVVSHIELINTTFQAGSTGDSILNHGAHVIWRDTASAFTGATLPAVLFNASGGGSYGLIELFGVDLSALGASTLYGTGQGSLNIVMTCCKLGSGYVPGAPNCAGARLDLINCDSGATNYVHGRYQQEGSHSVNVSLFRTGGLSIGSTPLSWNIVSTASCSFIQFFECLPIPIKNYASGKNVVVTLHGIWNSASLPNNDQIWLEVRYMGSSASPLSSMVTETKANNLAAGTALTADSASVWNSNVTARINSTAYTTAPLSTISVSSSTLVFYCIVAGTSSSSLPAGYATAVDGGSVTDGTATFRAGTRFLLTVTLSSPQPAQAGAMYAFVKVGAASATFNVDPLPVLG